MSHAGGEPGAPALGTIITDPAVRKIIYGIYTVLLLALGALTVWYGAQGAQLPSWGVGVSAVLGYLGIPVGGLAIANTPAKG